MEYTEEEIKAIEYEKNKLEEIHKEVIERQKDEFKGYGTLEDIAKLDYCYLKILLNLLEKLQREITTLENTKHNCPLINTSGVTCEMKERGVVIGMDFSNVDYIPKEAVREKIKELIGKLDKPNEDRWEKDDEIYYSKIKCQIKILKELLGE